MENISSKRTDTIYNSVVYTIKQAHAREMTGSVSKYTGIFYHIDGEIIIWSSRIPTYFHNSVQIFTEVFLRIRCHLGMTARLSKVTFFWHTHCARGKMLARRGAT